MLLYRLASADAARGVLRGAPEEQEALPEPLVEFLNWLRFMSPEQPGPYAGIADELERSVGGQINVEHSPTGAPSYTSAEAGRDPIPLSFASSLMAELAPVILTLRYSDSLSFLVLEEPEAHVHPQVQRALARALVRLVRVGVRVLVTTHSDLFCQEIDNLLKLGVFPQDQRAALQQELGGLHPDHYLRPDDVRGYSFRSGPEGTDVEEVTRTPYGLVMPTFNETLDALLADTRRLDAALRAAGQDA